MRRRRAGTNSPPSAPSVARQTSRRDGCPPALLVRRRIERQICSPLDASPLQRKDRVLTLDPIPFDPASQRRTERQWLTAVREHTAPAEVRSVVWASWERCLQARVQPDLPQAPLSLDDSALDLTRENADWLPAAHQVVGRREGSFGGPGHILTLFERLRRGAWYPVFDGGTPVGGCLVLETPTTGRRAPVRALAGATTSYTFADVVGESPRLVEATRLARAAARTALPVLLLGESGTGKEVFAQAIHAAGARAHRPFLAVNCAALPRELIEGELFGYTGGAYTGGRREGGIGKFEAADGGTIFLDEVAELPPGAQAALLRVLQEGEVTRVGSSLSRRVDVRVIAATNRDVAEALERGRLRVDVYHRLNVLRIELPPLRERRGDIRELTLRFLRDAAAELNRPDAALSQDVIEAFERLPWPGNLRELRNAVRRMVAVAEAFPVGGSDIAPAEETIELPAAGTDRLMEAVASARTMAEAASRLGITRSTLYRRLQRQGLRSHRILRPR